MAGTDRKEKHDFCPQLYVTVNITMRNSTLFEKGDQECPGHDLLMSRSAVRYVSSKSEA